MNEIKSPYFERFNLSYRFVGEGFLSCARAGDICVTSAGVQVFTGDSWQAVSTEPAETKLREFRRIPSVRLCPSCNSPVDLKRETCPYCSVPYPMKEIFE